MFIGKRSISSLKRVHVQRKSVVTPARARGVRSNVSHPNPQNVFSLHRHHGTTMITYNISASVLEPSQSNHSIQNIKVSYRPFSSSKAREETHDAAKESTHKVLDLDVFPLGSLTHSTMREVRELFDYWLKTYQEDGSDMACQILFRILDEGGFSPTVQYTSGMRD